jgi:TM2 domain-containing membrane protein YozV
VTDPWASPRPDPTLPAPSGYLGGYGVAPTMSHKSKIVAGLLQLIPGFLFAFGGIGRLYAGHRGLGIAQIVVSVVGWMAFWCGFVLVVPWFITAGAWLWFVVDGIVLIAGRPVDEYGRPLRS